MPSRHSELLLAQRVTSGGMLRIGLGEGKKVPSAHVSGWHCFCRVCLSLRISKKKSSPCGPYYFVWLNS